MKRKDGETDMDLWIRRQNKRSRMVFGVLEQAVPFPRGVSIAGVYVYINGNIETCKQIHRENLKVLRLMKTPRLP
jgi:hypothetical protein